LDQKNMMFFPIVLLATPANRQQKSQKLPTNPHANGGSNQSNNALEPTAKSQKPTAPTHYPTTYFHT
jgi:hypothetical protein